MPLTDEEHAIIMGTLLGDGHVIKRGANSYRIKIAHSVKQKEYIFWKYEKLKLLCQTTQGPVLRTDKKGYKTYEFYLSSGIHLEPYHRLFYEPTPKVTNAGVKVQYTKRINSQLIDRLPKNELVLATLYMDDGGARDDCYAARIAVHGFALDQIKLLVGYFDQCGITGSKPVLHTVKSQQYCLSLPAGNNTFAMFAAKIRPIVEEVPSMMYKLNDDRKPRND